MKNSTRQHTFFHKNSFLLALSAGLAFLPAACGCTFPMVAENDSQRNNIVINITTGSSKKATAQEDTFTILKLYQAISHKDDAAVIEEIPALIRICQKAKLEAMEDSMLACISFLKFNNHPKEAFETLEQVIKIYPESFKLTAVYAGVLSDRNMLNEAVTVLKKFAAKNKQYKNDINAELVGLYADHNKEDEVKALLANLDISSFTVERQLQYIQLFFRFQFYKKSRVILDDLIKKNPELYDAWQLKAILEKDTGNDKAAINICKKLLPIKGYSDFARVFLLEYSFSGKYKYPPQKLIFEAEDPLKFCLKSTQFFSKNKQTEEAEKIFQLYEKFSPNPTDIFFEYGAFLYLTSDNFKQAYELLDKVPPEHPDYARALCLKISIRYEKKDIKEIPALVEQFEKIENPESRSLFNLIEFLCYTQLEESATARLITKAQILYPDNLMSAFFRAYSFGNDGDMETAVALMEEIIKKDPNHALALNYVGYYLADQGKDLDRALQLIARADALLPRTDFIKDSIAWVLFKRKDYDKAWTVMEQLIQSLIQLGRAIDPSILEHYGDIAIEVGKKDIARKAWEEACTILEKNNKTEQLNTIKAKLEKLK